MHISLKRRVYGGQLAALLGCFVVGRVEAKSANAGHISEGSFPVFQHVSSMLLLQVG
jgi:hypothetical protein